MAEAKYGTVKCKHHLHIRIITLHKTVTQKITSRFKKILTPLLNLMYGDSGFFGGVDISTTPAGWKLLNVWAAGNTKLRGPAKRSVVGCGELLRTGCCDGKVETADRFTCPKLDPKSRTEPCFMLVWVSDLQWI